MKKLLVLLTLSVNAFAQTTGLPEHYGQTIVPRSAAKESAAIAAANSIDTSKTYAMISIGMSNTNQTFDTFMDLAADKHNNLIFVNGAQGGCVADAWAKVNNVCWKGGGPKNLPGVTSLLSQSGVTYNDVSAVWLRAVNRATQYSDIDSYRVNYEDRTRELVDNVLPSKFPNLKIIFVSGLHHTAYSPLTTKQPEPYAWWSNDIVDDVVNSGKAFWGPYTWNDGSDPRADGYVITRADFDRSSLGRNTDFVHLGPSGLLKEAQELLSFMRNDTAGSIVYYGNGDGPPPLPDPDPPPDPGSCPIDENAPPGTPCESVGVWDCRVWNGICRCSRPE